MKTVKILCMVLAMVMLLAGCGSRTITCDNCGKDINVKANSNITDEWTVFCSDCEIALFGEDGLVSAE